MLIVEFQIEPQAVCDIPGANENFQSWTFEQRLNFRLNIFKS